MIVELIQYNWSKDNQPLFSDVKNNHYDVISQTDGCKQKSGFNKNLLHNEAEKFTLVLALLNTKKWVQQMSCRWGKTYYIT